MQRVIESSRNLQKPEEEEKKFYWRQIYEKFMIVFANFFLLIIILLNLSSFAVQNICKKLYADIFKDSNIPLRHCSVFAHCTPHTPPPSPPISALGSFLWPNAMRVYAKKWREMVMFSNFLLPLQYVMPNICSDAAQSRANYLGHAPIAKKIVIVKVIQSVF